MRSVHGGRHELGQNFLVHAPTIRSIRDLVADTQGPILELGPGDGALTAELIPLGRDLRAIEIDEHRVHRLRRRHPGLDVQHGDALRVRYDRPVVVGNITFHITTPLLRRLLAQRDWQHAVLLTQWEVTRKRAGVGGATMMTAQSAPWFSFELHGRVAAHRFRPVPSVDGGILSITRRGSPLLPLSGRSGYVRFVRDVFTGRGRGIDRIVRARGGRRGAVRRAGIAPDALPRDLTPEQWAALWRALDEQ
ncbi:MULTISPECIES: 23S ribosomal RNA methyltransferase Erm [unclassified Microbacterium]|uniref:23S ribosomal RNA methyltransferase Erm n=1 Tax=unclassified Microbacterium TaxID=2609290 RepID=UPI0012FC38DD|nr:23S ribosomal RNA methyltransferase Erm [Microbacterium sp. MAH-37]MVQ42776.1 23S ribosomal RNA methyltransferase Erm [Microbacterium sp. MAH-37]